MRDLLLPNQLAKVPGQPTGLSVQIHYHKQQKNPPKRRALLLVGDAGLSRGLTLALLPAVLGKLKQV